MGERKRRRPPMVTPSRVVIGAGATAGFVVMTAAMGPLAVPAEPALVAAPSVGSVGAAQPPVEVAAPPGSGPAARPTATAKPPVIIIEVHRQVVDGQPSAAAPAPSGAAPAAPSAPAAAPATAPVQAAPAAPPAAPAPPPPPPPPPPPADVAPAQTSASG